MVMFNDYPAIDAAATAVGNGVTKLAEEGLPLGGTIAILKKVSRKEPLDWKDAKDIL